MRTLQNKSLRKFSDKELLLRIEKLGAKERAAMLAILIYLIEIERRSLHLKQGYSSLYDFCVNHLGYSESAAARRMRAARCIRDFPEIYKMLSSGDLNLCSVSKIAGVLTRENKKILLREIAGRSAREMDMIISRYHPKSSPRDRVRPIYVMTETENSEESVKKFTADVGSKKVDTFEGTVKNKGSCESKNDEKRCPARVKMEQEFKLEFAVDHEFMDTLEKLKALLSTKYPRGLDFEKLFEIIMDDYLDRHSPEGRIKRRVERSAKANKLKKKGQVKRAKPQAQNIDAGTSTQAKRAKSQAPVKATACVRSNYVSNGSRYISQSIRDEVFMRDGGRCTYVGPNGKRCLADKYLQIDHIVPFAKGGDNSLYNLRLLCARHNNLEAEREYGKEYIMQLRRMK